MNWFEYSTFWRSIQRNPMKVEYANIFCGYSVFKNNYFLETRIRRTFNYSYPHKYKKKSMHTLYYFKLNKETNLISNIYSETHFLPSRIRSNILYSSVCNCIMHFQFYYRIYPFTNIMYITGLFKKLKESKK